MSPAREDTPARTDEIVAFLRRPASYAEGASGVETVETHISYVFLTDRFAYKLKKPVRFEFLDFRALDARRQACQAELALNRRLAGEVYLGLVSLTERPGGGLAWDGPGEPVEWLVKMRRLPAERAMDVLIRGGQLGDEDILAVGRTLADFYETAARVEISASEYLTSLEQRVRANRDDLAASHDEPRRALAAALHAAQLRYVLLRGEQLTARVRAGRVIDGHGDLRPEHVYLAPAPVVIDCIEFSREFRTIDPADELAFLAMECDRLGAPQVGRQITETCAERLGDQPPEDLVLFYKSFRACVRAKVALLRGRQATGEAARRAGAEADEYLHLAETYLTGMGPPVLIAVGGLSGTGKSTLAQALAERLAAELNSTDRLRRKMFAAAAPNEYDAGAYTPENRRRVYDALFDWAGQTLVTGATVILDGTFEEPESQAAVLELAARRGAVPLVVHCRCPADVAIARIERRRQAGGSFSDADAEVYRRQAAAAEKETEQAASIKVDTTASIEQQVDQVLDALGELYRAGPAAP